MGETDGRSGLFEQDSFMQSQVGALSKISSCPLTDMGQTSTSGNVHSAFRQKSKGNEFLWQLLFLRRLELSEWQMWGWDNLIVFIHFENRRVQQRARKIRACIHSCWWQWSMLRAQCSLRGRVPALCQVFTPVPEGFHPHLPDLVC